MLTREKKAADEASVFKALSRELSDMPQTRMVGASVALVSTFLLAASGQAATIVIPGVLGSLATIAGVVVALAIFRWTQRENVEQSGKFAALNEQVRRALSASGRVDPEEPDDEIIDADPSDSIPLEIASAFDLAGKAYAVTDRPDKLSVGWWRDVLQRVESVADKSPNDRPLIEEFMGLPLDAFRGVGTLAASQRGNRRTIFITESDESLRYWSLFRGKGRHFRDITDQVESSG